MPVITYKHNHYETEADESVLDALLRHNIDIPYACKAGVCHVCVMRCQQGLLTPGSTVGLKDAEVAHGNFLACQCNPTENLSISDADEFGLFSQAIVVAKDYLSGDVCRIRMRAATDLHYRAGQFINLRMPVGDIRSYSLASLPAQDDFLELQVKRMLNGVVSNWLFDQVQSGDTLDIQGPFGDCFYTSESIENEILMIGTGTGAAPLIGILREAIENGHKGPISFYHGESHATGLYLDNELRELVSGRLNIRYFPCALSTGDREIEGIFQGKASDIAFMDNPNLADCLIYLCGSPSMVEESRKQALSNGAALNQIYTDPFVTKDLRLGKERG